MPPIQYRSTPPILSRSTPPIPYETLCSELNCLRIKPQDMNQAQLKAYIIARLWTYASMDLDQYETIALYNEFFKGWNINHFLAIPLYLLDELIGFLQEKGIYISAMCSPAAGLATILGGNHLFTGIFGYPPLKKPSYDTAYSLVDTLIGIDNLKLDLEAPEDHNIDPIVDPVVDPIIDPVNIASIPKACQGDVTAPKPSLGADIHVQGLTANIALIPEACQGVISAPKPVQDTALKPTRGAVQGSAANIAPIPEACQGDISVLKLVHDTAARPALRAVLGPAHTTLKPIRDAVWRPFINTILKHPPVAPLVSDLKPIYENIQKPALMPIRILSRMLSQSCFPCFIATFDSINYSPHGTANITLPISFVYAPAPPLEPPPLVNSI
jgi:hypothetical protein